MDSHSHDIQRDAPRTFWLWFVLCGVALLAVVALLLIGSCTLFIIFSMRKSPNALRPSGDDRAYLLEELRSPVRSIAISPDGTLVAVGCHDGSIHQWDLATGKPGPAIQGHRGIVSGLAFMADGQTLISASHDKTVTHWDVNTGNAKKTFPGHQVAIWSLSRASAGNRVATAGPYDERQLPVSGEIKVWDLALGAEKDLGLLPKNVHGATSVALSSDGNDLFIGSTDSTVKRWDLNDGTIKDTFQGFHESIWSLALSQDGKLLAAGDNSGDVRIWDVATTKEMHLLRTIRDPVQSMTFTADGKTLATVAHDRTIRFWDTVSGKLVASLKDEDSHPSYLAFTPDGKKLACGRAQYDEAGRPLVGDTKVWDVTRVLPPR